VNKQEFSASSWRSNQGLLKLLNINMFWFSLQLLSEPFLVLRRIQRDIIIKTVRRHIYVTCPLILSDFNKTMIFSTVFRKKYSNFMEIRAVGTVLFHVNHQTDMLKLVVSLHIFSNASKRYEISKLIQKWLVTWISLLKKCLQLIAEYIL